jgi:hypothetical protein
VSPELLQREDEYERVAALVAPMFDQMMRQPSDGAALL